MLKVYGRSTSLAELGQQQANSGIKGEARNIIGILVNSLTEYP